VKDPQVRDEGIEETRIIKEKKNTNPPM